MRPHIPGAKAVDYPTQLGRRMWRVAVEQNTPRNFRCPLFDALDRLRIKGVQGEPVSMPPRYTDDGLLDVHPFELDVCGRRVADDVQNVRKARHPRSTAEIHAGEIAPGRARDHVAVGDVIVVNDDLSVSRGMNVELDGIGAMLDGEEKTGEGVFNPLPWRAAVCDPFRRIWTTTIGSGFQMTRGSGGREAYAP